MWVALTGTPGTGKTTVATLLRNKGYTIVDVNKLAIREGFVAGVDKKRRCKLIDIKKINAYLRKHFNRTDLVFFEGHTAHLLKAVDKIIILRCHPNVLCTHLVKKKWGPEKIQENLEAELLDIILCEAVDVHPKSNIFEIDTTGKTPADITRSVLEIVKKKFRPIKQYRIGQIDWSEEILKQYPLSEETHGS
jgi:adenylate kinase